MDQARYYLALYLLMFSPGALLYWFSIHPFIRFWRRVGVPATLVIHYGLVLAVAGILFAFRKPLLSVDYGTQPVTIALAVPLFVFSIMQRVKISRQLKQRILQGIPELAPDKHPTPLLTEGAYARVRNPRYLQLMLAFLALALFTNYLASYVVVVGSVILIWVIIWMEEKELRDRYGRAFDEYCARVPRLIPRFHKS